MQTKITSYFKLIESIEGIVADNPSLVTFINQSGDKHNTNPVAFTSLLQRLLQNALLNSEKLPRQYRHDEVLNKIAVSLFIYAGPVAYSFIQQNMPQALPSLRSVQRFVHNEYLIIHEGEFRFDELFVHLNRYNAPKIITIGEDATRLIVRVDYDSETNRLVGFVLPLNSDGLPLLNAHLAVSFVSIKESFRNSVMSKYAFVYMAQPLLHGAPAFVLACIGTDNRFCAEDVQKQWSYILTECKIRDITVVSFGADGDSRELKSIQLSVQLFNTCCHQDYLTSHASIPVR